MKTARRTKKSQPAVVPSGLASNPNHSDLPMSILHRRCAEGQRGLASRNKLRVNPAQLVVRMQIENAEEGANTK
jgi:hypothetical protein